MDDRDVHVLINSKSGFVLKHGRDYILQSIEANLPRTENISFLDPEKLQDAIQSAVKTDSEIFVGGGDGTFLSAAPVFMHANKAMGMIPMGTMNLLARDLNLPDKLDALLQSYARGTREMAIDVGKVNDEIFLCAAGWGTIPQSVEFREENRDQMDPVLIPRLAAFVFQHLDHTHHRKAKLRIDSKKKFFKTASLVISNNQYIEKDGEENSFIRQSLQDNVLGVYSARPATVWDRLRLLLRLKTGEWKNDAAIRKYTGRHIVMQTDSKYEDIALDGELKTLSTPLGFSVVHKGLKVLVPKAAEEQP